jgi:hypothetical protein
MQRLAEELLTLKESRPADFVTFSPDGTRPFCSTGRVLKTYDATPPPEKP